MQRELSIDLVKAIAIFGVLVIHIVSGELTHGMIGSLQWTCGLFWGALVRGSVPLFLMASGAIMLDPMKKLSIKRLYFHNITRIIVAMLVWGFCYKVYHLYITGQMNIPMLWYCFKRLLVFDQEFHFYYIHIILLVYAFLPITRIFVEKADKRTMQYALCLWAVLAIAYPTFLKFAPFALSSGIPRQWMINLTYASIGYGILGYYLKKYPFSRLKAAICLYSGFFVTFGMTFYLSVHEGRLNDLFLQGISPGVFLLAIGIFSINNDIKVKERFQRAIIFFSKASFCIYLSHMFILYMLTHFGIVAQMLPIIFAVPLITILTLFICSIIYIVISRIPFLNEWII